MTFSGKREWSEKGHERGSESKEHIGKRKSKGERRVYIHYLLQTSLQWMHLSLSWAKTNR